MEMKGSRVVPASVDQTWEALNDPDALKACIAGCETVERTSDNEFRVVMTARVGPVSAKFNGRINLADVVAPKSYTLRFEGQGGAAGFANGAAQVALAAEGQGTRIDYIANAQVGGKLAQIGSRLIDGVAAKVADDFFACFAARLGAAPAPASAVAAPADVQAAAMRKLWIRLALAIVIVAAMAIYWMTRPVSG